METERWDVTGKKVMTETVEAFIIRGDDVRCVYLLCLAKFIMQMITPGEQSIASNLAL